ncbi:TIGR02444 family protein [Alteromonas sp. a30]|uniref:TIGR02444 family protein n=1 Tax=Alteromonas sp. a30 TaxID=2730917 RepID=UPI00227EE3AF|nr:TIGR02444 family protein [Alteromonas sp. a30]MCY7295651.1 TIGR02444 family protein [Alteromonas sp. a30]
MTAHDKSIQYLSQQFWDFSLEFYSFGDVQRLVLTLQDEFDLNVNLLLLCGFLSDLDCALSENNIEQLIQGINASEAQIKTLREKRRATKSVSQVQYHALKQQELEMEQHQQRKITELVHSFNIIPSKEKRGSACHLTNLRTYINAKRAYSKGNNDEIEPFILDLNTQFQAFTQAKHNAK